jgi:hypothetical protein
MRAIGAIQRLIGSPPHGWSNSIGSALRAVVTQNVHEESQC